MKILVLAQDYKPMLGGIATATYELCLALQKSGESVKLLAPEFNEGDSLGDRAVPFEVHRVRGLGGSFLSAFRWKKVVQEELKSFQPDVVLSTLWLPCSVGVWLYRGGLGWRKKNREFPPFFTIVHGVEIIESTRTFKKRLRKWLAPIKRSVFRSCTGVLAVSRFTAQVLSQETGIPIGEIGIIYNGVNLTEFFKTEFPNDPRQSLTIPVSVKLESETVFLTLSRLEDYKGMDFFIRSLEEVKKKFPNIVYLIAGKGPDQARLEALRDELNLQKEVHFLGVIPEGNLGALYALCDVFVLLSRDDRLTPNFEGLGIVLLEAAACGKPSIAGRSGGMPEVVLDQKTGWVVDPEGIPEIVRAVEESIQNSVKRDSFGKAARARVEENFTWTLVASRLLQEIRKKC